MAHKNPKQKVKWEGVITNIQNNVLTNLAKYKFLTLSQLLQLEVGTTQYKYLWKQVASLRDRNKPLVKCQRFSVSQPQNGNPPERVEDWYYLNNTGKKVLIEELNFKHEIRLPIGRGNLAYKDYQHRKRTIDFQILLNLCSKENNYNVSFFDSYFEKMGNNRRDKNLRAKTRIDFEGDDFFIPDGAFKLAHQNKNKFYLFEMYSGRDTKRTLAQLHKHGLSLTQRFTHRAYELPVNKPYFIILLFQYESIKNALIEKAKKEGRTFSLIEKYFRCKSIEQLEKDNFISNWKTLFGSSTSLF